MLNFSGNTPLMEDATYTVGYANLDLATTVIVTSTSRGQPSVFLPAVDGFKCFWSFRPENVEVFHKKQAAQEKAYRFKVHEGKETLRKTSQVRGQLPAVGKFE